MGGIVMCVHVCGSGGKITGADIRGNVGRVFLSAGGF